MYIYEKTIEDVMENGLVRKANKDEQSGTMMIISDEIERGITQLKNDQSAQWTIEQIAIHGLSCMEHECKKEIKEIEKLQLKLSYAKSPLIREWTSNTKVSMDSIRKKKKQSVRVRGGILSAFGRYAKSLSIDNSAIFRICMYFSFTTSQTIAEDVRGKAELEKGNFIDRIKDMWKVFDALEILEGGKKNER